MKKKSASHSGLFNPRVLVAFALCSVGVSLAMLSFAGPSPNPLTATVPGFHAPVTIPGSSGGSEPSLAITSNGIRYVSWQAPGQFAKSADGVNFTQITTPDTGATGDVTNAIGSNGAVYNGQICGSATTLHTCIYRSTDGGATWQQRNMLADMHPGASDRPWITVLPGTDPDHDTVYLEFHTFTPDDLVYVTKSTDGGSTFGPAIPVEQGTNALDSTCNTIPGGIIVDHSNGNVYALWLAGDDVVQNETTGCNYSQIGPFPKAYVSKSTDGGTTWTPVLAYQGAFDLATEIGDNAGKIFSTITEDKSGQIHIGLSVRHNDNPRQFVADCQTNANCLESPNPTDMYIVTSPDQGAHWTQPFKVNQTVGSFFFPWIHAGSAGRLDVANYSSTTLRPNDPTSIWFVGMSQVTGAVAHFVSGPNATYDSTPVATPQILLDPNRVHGNGTTGGGICTYGLFCIAVPGSNRNLADVFEVHLDPAGGANVAWTSDNGGNHIGFACQDSGPSAFAGMPDLNGCYSSVAPTSVVSRMTHGAITTPFDINLPLPVGTSPRGVECRTSGSLGAGNYRLVFTFPASLTSVGSATVTNHDPTSGTGSVSGPVIVGPNVGLGLTANQCAVNLTNVSNGQYITVTLNGVLDAIGNSVNVTGPQMGVLIGDVNASGLVDSGDVFLVRQQTSQSASASNFRDDVNASGLIDSGDVFITRQHTSQSLPSAP